MSGVDDYLGGVGRGEGLPACIGKYRQAMEVTGLVMMRGAWGDVVEVTVEAGKSPI